MTFFVAIQVEKPHGIMEWWNVGKLGMKSKKRSILKNIESAFYDDARQISIFCFRLIKYATITRKSIQLYSL